MSPDLVNINIAEIRDNFSDIILKLKKNYIWKIVKLDKCDTNLAPKL